MNRFILALVTVLIVYSIWVDTAQAHGNYAYIELGLGNNTNLSGSSIPWDDGGGTAAMFSFGYAFMLENDVQLEVHWSHFSQLDVGAIGVKPLNNISPDESSLDHFGIKIRKRF